MKNEMGLFFQTSREGGIIGEECTIGGGGFISDSTVCQIQIDISLICAYNISTRFE